ncbi:MAG: hypothetical protein WA964_16615 [Ilumatobacter sp.]|uniref:hypothetical protein n=1 Tax=Ilumatobacter sp. TaxID=1967498 RepID=UPI003C768546
MASVPIEIHRLLAVQHGQVARDQLLEHLSANQIKHLSRRGDLSTAGRNVYRSPSFTETELSRCAALCLGRPGVVIAGPTAGRLWEFRKMTADQRLHVLMSPHANSVQTTRSIVARRTSTLSDHDVELRVDSIRVTSRARTCLDLARHVRPDPLLSVIEQAMLDGNLNETDMRAVAIGLIHRRPWVRTYLAQLDRRLDGAPGESDGEVRIGDALVAHGVRGLVRQYPMTLPGHGTVRFDLAVPRLMWAVEVDLFPTHEQTIGAASDARRDLASTRAGWAVRRVTRCQYDSEFNATIAGLVADVRNRALLFGLP